MSLTLYLATLAVFARWMPERTRASLWFRTFAAVVCLSILAEMAWIAGAAAFGTGSHFNVATPFMSAVYSLMGLFAVTLTSATHDYIMDPAMNPAIEQQASA